MSPPYYTAESLESQNSIGFLVKRCGIVMTQVAERAFESHPVFSHSMTFTQWTVLAQLSERSSASPTEISNHMGHDMGALTRLVDTLECEGLIRRERSKEDRRAVQIAITPEGLRAARAGKRLLVDLLNELVAPYSKAEVDALISVLQRLLSRMQSLDDPAPSETKQRARRSPRK